MIPASDVRYSAGDIAAMLRTPLGRFQILHGLRYRAWPLYNAAATLHRRRLAGRTRFVAVVGSFGKSTAMRATAAVLGRSDPDQRFDTRNSWSGVAAAVLRARPTDSHVVIEAGIDGPGQMRRYAEMLRPDLTVVTSVGSEHHRSLGSLERTRDEKADMVRALGSDGLAVLNGDDPNVRWMAGQTRGRVVTYGFARDNDVVGSDLRLEWPHGTAMRVSFGERTVALRTRLIGEKMAYAALAAMATAVAEGRDPEQAAADLGRLPPTPGRLEPVELEGGAWLLRDDYKSALETVRAALDVLEQVPARRKLVVLGEVSEPPGRQGPIYRAIGERLAGIADRVIVLGGTFQRVLAGARRGGMPAHAVVGAGRSPARAVELLRAELGRGDVVLVKGRDTERLDRIHLALTGTPVGCDIAFCDAKLRCADCPMLETGWGRHRVVI